MLDNAFVRTFVDQERTYSFSIGKAEILVDLGFPEIESHQHGLFPVKSKNGGQVNGDESFPGAYHVRCYQHGHLRFSFGDEGEVCADRPE
jgi:hypothetical protein